MQFSKASVCRSRSGVSGCFCFAPLGRRALSEIGLIVVGHGSTSRERRVVFEGAGWCDNML
jgi:hypothetical protein